MRLLLIHADFMEYTPTGKTKFAETTEDKGQRVEDCLVAFTAVERGDDENVCENAVSEIKAVAKKVNVKRVVLYPYAHLSSNLAEPKMATAHLLTLEKGLANELDVCRAPFGWYKSFKISCKGHPLSELSRELKPTKVPTEMVSEAVARVKELRSEWYVLTPEGRLIDAEEFDFTGHDGLRILYEHEMGGTRAVKTEPKHVELMRRLELVDYEPASDPGNLRWYPKGQLIKKLLETHVTNMCANYGAMQVETPIMYDYQHHALGKYLQKFPARQYIVKSEDKEFFLRFAACFGQYLIAHDAQISYKALPLRLYELTHYSFRREQRGELTGLKRLRCFTMPDMHTLCADLDDANAEAKRQFMLSMDWMRGLNVEYEGVVRFVKDYYDEHKALAEEMARALGRPMLVEIWSQRFFYFMMKFEFNVNDSQNKASALSTVQIDIENTQRFDITYVDKTGIKKHPVLLHASISGGIDRCLYALLETQAKLMAQGRKPELPFWLAPTQIRLIPVSDEFIEDCERIADALNARVDIDDREEKVGKRIRDAEMVWVNIIIVVGAKERGAKKLPTRLRSGELKAYSLKELTELVASEMAGYPYMGLPLPRLLSKRVVFRG